MEFSVFFKNLNELNLKRNQKSNCKKKQVWARSSLLFENFFEKIIATTKSPNYVYETLISIICKKKWQETQIKAI